MDKRTCLSCGCSIARGRRCMDCKKSRCGTTNSYREGCRCGDCRAANTEYQVRYQRAYKTEHGTRSEARYRPNKDLGYVCAECGSPVRGTGSAGKAADGLILCVEHRAAKRDRDRMRLRKRRAFQRKIEKAVEGTSGNPRWPFFQGACWTCGEVFVRRGVPTPYCSKECNPKSEWRGWIKPRLRFEIYERDGWICQICFRPVGPDLPAGHRLSASLDHIEPRSLALIPNHSPENLRLAHVACNASRGNRVEAAA